MFVKKKDVDDLESYLNEFSEDEDEDRDYVEPQEGPSVNYFFDRPHLILPIGFDETRPLISENIAEWMDNYNQNWVQNGVKEALLVESKYGLNKISFDFGIETIFRNISTGAWYWFLGLEYGELIFRGPNESRIKYSAEELLNKLRSFVNCPDHNPKTLWLPRIWTPEFQDSDRQKLNDDVLAIIKSVKAENSTLRDIKPHLLEELIAELLRSRGLEIYVTPKTRDGGRDIIARGETLLGEPIIMAIEIKQKSVVGIDDLYRTLKANENYPAIMLVTAGRFSAGVIREKQRDSNNLRLILKDGIALSQWIEAYGYHRDVRNTFKK